MPTQEKRTITAADLYRCQLLSPCEISPDGRHVVFAVQRVDRTDRRIERLRHIVRWLDRYLK